MAWTALEPSLGYPPPAKQQQQRDGCVQPDARQAVMRRSEGDETAKTSTRLESNIDEQKQQQKANQTANTNKIEHTSIMSRRYTQQTHKTTQQSPEINPKAKSIDRQNQSASIFCNNQI